MFEFLTKPIWVVVRKIPLVGDALNYLRILLGGCREGDIFCRTPLEGVLSDKICEYINKFSKNTGVSPIAVGFTIVGGLYYFKYKKKKPKTFTEALFILLEVGSILSKPELTMLVLGLEAVADRNTDTVDMPAHKQKFPEISIEEQAKARALFKAARTEQLKKDIQEPRRKLALIEATKQAYREATAFKVLKTGNALIKENVKKSSFIDTLNQILSTPLQPIKQATPRS